jgi:mRNA interferase RelE/StbE
MLARRIVAKIQRLEHDLAGDVNRLTNFTPEYRLRVGDWRILFDVDGDSVVVQHVSHRSKA